LSSSRSVSCVHTRWKSRPPERLRPLGSPARVRTAITFLGSVDGGTTTRFRSCSRRWRLSFLFLAARHRADDRHCNISARHRAGRLHQQSTMSLSGASGTAAGYADLILKIAIFVISVNTVIDMLYLRDSTCHALLVSTSFIFMMSLMMNLFDKHIYDIIFMYFLLASYLWNKLNMKLPRFVTLTSWYVYLEAEKALQSLKTSSNTIANSDRMKQQNHETGTYPLCIISLWKHFHA